MKTMTLFVFILLLGLPIVNNFALVSDFSEYTNDQIVEAIGKAENSAKYPYGIKSIPTYGNKELARKYCFNSVRNGRARWIKAGRPQDLISYIGLRYCPPQAHQLNSNWSRNVKFFLQKGGE